MSEYQVRQKSPRISERPHCDECNLDMWLLDIKPARPGQETRTFECARCGAGKTLLCESGR